MGYGGLFVASWKRNEIAIRPKKIIYIYIKKESASKTTFLFWVHIFFYLKLKRWERKVALLGRVGGTVGESLRLRFFFFFWWVSFKEKRQNDSAHIIPFSEICSSSICLLWQTLIPSPPLSNCSSQNTPPKRFSALACIHGSGFLILWYKLGFLGDTDTHLAMEITEEAERPSSKGQAWLDFSLIQDFTFFIFCCKPNSEARIN